MKFKHLTVNSQLSIMLLLFLFCALPLKAQVTIGKDTVAHKFSVLELRTDQTKGGLRMPQLTTHQRDSIKDILLGDVDLATAANGLAIYNMDNNCLEFWEETKWVSLCSSILIAPLSVVISPTETSLPLLSTTPLTATVTPADATAVQYKWEYSLNEQDWFPVDGQNAKIINAMAIKSDTWYRVTAFNESGSAMSNVAHITGLSTFTITNPNIQMYVGAFWRSNERGERIIQFSVGNGLNNDGDWAAVVAWYDDNWNPTNTANPDGVTLAINSSPLSLPLSDMDAENHPVTGGSQFITGTVANNGTISFRIGLDKHFENYNAVTNPARYAVVYLSCNNGNKKYKLFIRQGEGDDYVMRPQDSGESGQSWGTPNPRPNAVKFSPYNLTDPSGKTATTMTNLLTPATSGFTNFPTKAGYCFIFSDVFAVSPDVPAAPDLQATVTSWNQNIGQHSTTNPYWVTSWETCPSGYRRPTDGPVDAAGNPTNTSAHGVGAVAGSEIRQSLWLNPPSGTNLNSDNSIWGYYADGFFDRRAPQTARGQAATISANDEGSAVAISSADVAYIGKLFFNPTTNASLFFPGVGYRFWQSGALYDAGARARYWTSTSQSQSNSTSKNAWFLYFYSTVGSVNTYMGYDDEGSKLSNSSKTSGGMVRCVKQ